MSEQDAAPERVVSIRHKIAAELAIAHWDSAGALVSRTAHQIAQRAVLSGHFAALMSRLPQGAGIEVEVRIRVIVPEGQVGGGAVTG